MNVQLIARPAKPFRPWSACYHEAGHAVCAWVLGAKVVQIFVPTPKEAKYNVVPGLGESHGQTWTYLPTIKAGDQGRCAAEICAAISLAGSAAQARATHQSINRVLNRNGVADRLDTIQHLSAYADKDGEKLRNSWRRSRDIAKYIVKDRRSRVAMAQVAVILQQSGIITGMEFNQKCAEAFLHDQILSTEWESLWSLEFAVAMATLFPQPT